MSKLEVLNIVAIIVSPIIAVLIAQWLGIQRRNRKVTGIAENESILRIIL